MSLPTFVQSHFESVLFDHAPMTAGSLDLRRYEAAEDGSMVDRVLEAVNGMAEATTVGEFVANSTFEGLAMLSPDDGARVERLKADEGVQLALTYQGSEQPSIFVQASRHGSARDYVRVEIHGDIAEVDHWHYSSNASAHISLVQSVHDL